MSIKDLAADVRTHAAYVAGGAAEYGLADYLADSGLDLGDIYRRTTWTALRLAAFLDGPRESQPQLSAQELNLLRRMRALIHVDDSERADAYTRISSVTGPTFAELSPRDRCYARMLITTLWPDGHGHRTYSSSLDELRRCPSVCNEIGEVLAISSDASRRVPMPLGDEIGSVPLYSHAAYRREEILAALGWADIEAGKFASNHREGVAWCEAARTDALLVTLNKSERQFSPNTMYKDYALNAGLFHWESQNAASTSSPVGKRYLDAAGSRSHVVLFVRHARKDDDGLAVTFRCLGQVDYVSHSGEKPIEITWKLRRNMPADTLLAASAVAR
jgi:hypothetical protein